jgi:aminopeptidase
VIGVPSAEWAKAVFPDLSEEEAFEKLGDAIFAVTRVTEDNDPIAAWEQHDKEMTEHADRMNEYRFKTLHFTRELGTDLFVDLVDDHIWVGGGCTTPAGVFFDPNMPTEECFCMPLKTGVNGIVYASKPLDYQGKVIEDFWVRFENGKAVDFDAKKEKDGQFYYVGDKGTCSVITRGSGYDESSMITNRGNLTLKSITLDGAAVAAQLDLRSISSPCDSAGENDTGTFCSDGAVVPAR